MPGFFKVNDKSSREEGTKDILFQGQKTEDIRFVQSGSMQIYLSIENFEENVAENLLECSYKILTMEANKTFVGLTDILSSGEYAFSYVLSETDKSENHSIRDASAIESAFDNLPQDSCIRVQSTANLVNSLFNAFSELVEFNNELDRLISCSSVYYWFFKEAHSISRAPRNKVLSEGIEKYNLLQSKGIKLSYSFIPADFEEYQNIGFELCFQNNQSFDAGKIRYFQCLLDVKQDVLNTFMSSDSYLERYHCMEAAQTINQLREDVKNELIRSKQLFSQFFSDTEDGLVTELIRLIIEVRQRNMDTAAILDLIEYITDKYKEAVTYFEEKYDRRLGVNFNKLNMLLGSLKPNHATNLPTEVSSNEHIPLELNDSLNRIVEFADLDKDKADFLKRQIETFKSMESKDRYELMPREAKNRVTSIFFELYESAVKRVIKENVSDRAVDMFLMFGFMDSGLLTRQQILGLNKLVDEYSKDCNIYSAKEWLTRVYNKQKAPSISELGVDYEQMLREGKAKGSSKNFQAAGDLDSGDNRLNYEISNMIKTTHKLCYGQISTYFPILHNDMLPNDISRIAVTISKVNESLLNIMNEDFSAFHREIFYTGDNPNLKKELIMKQVIPDVILMPTAGSKAIMWQEITGRSKLSPGRFIMPILTSEDVNSLVFKLTSSFRWELCRTVMGVHWNDITYKSLTSEYADYIQDYKKNKNLSQENKEKVKIQIQRHHYNLREIFSSDYEAWIKYEAKNIRKVNKEVREILYKYCPFKRSVREQLIKQPAFADVAAGFEYERKKIARELENRYNHYVKQGYVLEPEFEENLRFYKEL